MSSLNITAILTAAALFVLALLWSSLAGFFWRRRLIGILKTTHSDIWARAVASPDVADPLGRPMPSSSFLLKVVAEARNRGTSDPQLIHAARWLKRSNTTLIICAVLLIALTLVGKLQRQ